MTGFSIHNACWAMALCLVLCSCGASAVSLRHGSRHYTPQDYEKVYERWTREHDAFDVAKLEDVLAVTATYESWDFRWAYVVRYADDHSLGPDERRTLLDASLQDSRRVHSFFVTLAGQRFREGDLSSKDSVWRVVLVDEKGRTVAPSGIEKIARPMAPERVYFPSISPHRQAFRMTFPVNDEHGRSVIAAGAKRVLLRFTGALGTVDLVWRLKS